MLGKGYYEFGIRTGLLVDDNSGFSIQSGNVISFDFTPAVFRALTDCLKYVDDSIVKYSYKIARMEIAFYYSVHNKSFFFDLLFRKEDGSLLMYDDVGLGNEGVFVVMIGNLENWFIAYELIKVAKNKEHEFIYEPKFDDGVYNMVDRELAWRADS